jgi:hypothetical protein
VQSVGIRCYLLYSTNATYSIQPMLPTLSMLSMCVFYNISGRDANQRVFDLSMLSLQSNIRAIFTLCTLSNQSMQYSANAISSIHTSFYSTHAIYRSMLSTLSMHLCVSFQQNIWQRCQSTCSTYECYLFDQCYLIQMNRTHEQPKFVHGGRRGIIFYRRGIPQVLIPRGRVVRSAEEKPALTSACLAPSRFRA